MTAIHASPDELDDAAEPASPPPGRHGRRALPAQRHRVRNGHADAKAVVANTSAEPAAAALGVGPPQFEAAAFPDLPAETTDTLAARAQVLCLILGMRPLDPVADPQTAQQLRSLFAQADPTSE